MSHARVSSPVSPEELHARLALGMAAERQVAEEAASIEQKMALLEVQIAQGKAEEVRATALQQEEQDREESQQRDEQSQARLDELEQSQEPDAASINDRLEMDAGEWLSENGEEELVHALKEDLSLIHI